MWAFMKCQHRAARGNAFKAISDNGGEQNYIHYASNFIYVCISVNANDYLYCGNLDGFYNSIFSLLYKEHALLYNF